MRYSARGSSASSASRPSLGKEARLVLRPLGFASQLGQVPGPASAPRGLRAHLALGLHGALQALLLWGGWEGEGAGMGVRLGGWV